MFGDCMQMHCGVCNYCNLFYLHMKINNERNKNIPKGQYYALLSTPIKATFGHHLLLMNKNVEQQKQQKKTRFDWERSNKILSRLRFKMRH